MTSLSRRSYLLAAGTTAVTALAGCLDGDNDDDAEFRVTNTQLIHQEGSDRFTFPEDVLVRVEYENGHRDSREGTMIVTLRHDPGTGADDVEEWQKEDPVHLYGITSTLNEYVFEDVFEVGNDIEDYTAEAEIEAA